MLNEWEVKSDFRIFIGMQYRHLENQFSFHNFYRKWKKYFKILNLLHVVEILNYVRN